MALKVNFFKFEFLKAIQVTRFFLMDSNVAKATSLPFIYCVPDQFRGGIEGEK